MWFLLWIHLSFKSGKSNYVFSHILSEFSSLPLPLGFAKANAVSYRKFYLAFTVNVSFLSCTLWFLVSLQENSSWESYIYKVLQGSPLSLLLASYMFNSSGLPLWVSAFQHFSSNVSQLHWAFLAVSKAQCHLPGTAMYGAYIKGTPQGAPGQLPFSYCHSSALLNTVLLQFCIAKSCLSYHLQHLRAP